MRTRFADSPGKPVTEKHRRIFAMYERVELQPCRIIIGPRAHGRFKLNASSLTGIATP